MTRKFHPKWEALVEEEKIVGTGVWYYQDKIPYKAVLIAQRWNYTSFDLVELDEILEIPFCDYIDYRISDEGTLYHWEFTGPNGTTSSPSFSTYFEARDHINTYGQKYRIRWEKRGS